MSKPAEVETENRPRRMRADAAQTEPEPLGMRKQLMLSLGVLGVCYGDLGTSAIYALHAAMTGGPQALEPDRVTVLGILSLVFWTLIIIVSLKYMVFVMRADNRGEGGMFALMALLRPWRHLERLQRRVLVLVGLVGAAMLYAGIMITPAITILSAVEGLEIASPVLGDYVIVITMVILVALFAVQRLGTARIGVIFGPVMSVWFLTIAALGVYGIVHEPSVLLAVNPVYAVQFFQHDNWTAFAILFGIFLVTTGAEACYADIGHFGRRPIQMLWFVVVLPALLLNYFGQGAMLLHNPGATTPPFFHLVPRALLYPVVAIATAATVVASQAVISGAFSMTRQASRLGMMPRAKIVQTSADVSGQIYIPAVNWVLMATTLFLVLTFESSAKLASVYGISVSTTMVVTTILAFFVARERGHWKLWAALLFLVGFLSVDLAYFGSNLLRVPDGGWFPIAVAVVIFTIMSTWRRGGELVAQETEKDAKPVDVLKQELKTGGVARVPGVAVFITARLKEAPPSLSHHIERNHALQERVVLLTVLTEDVPRTTMEERIDFQPLGEGFSRLVLRYGYMQQPNVPSDLAVCKGKGLEIDLDEATYYVERQLPIGRRGRHKGMALWRDHLLGYLMRNSKDPTSGYQIPSDQVIEMGRRVRI